MHSDADTVIARVEPDAEFDIAHVLCTDIVGYSKLLIDQQSEQLAKLNHVVRETEAFCRAAKSGKLLCIPTGDGMVLVFFTHPQDPAECAVQLARGLQPYPEIKLRIGVHSGPVNRITDLNQRVNVAGAGINMAQRVMDCADAGHILFSKRVAEDLAHYARWQPHLRYLGEFEVKHGVKLKIFNFYDQESGNAAIPEKLRQQERNASTKSRRKLVIPLSAAAATLVAAAVFWLVLRWLAQTSLSSVPERSIAIFPFKPLVAQSRDEFLENGMADTLIAKLSVIRDLVIPALTSAQKYAEQETDPRAAGRLLHVKTVLDGRLQKLGDRLRVTARLLSVESGTAMWTQTFDEKFTDVFAVQDRIAQKVADALALRLNGEEQNRLTKRDTENTEAYQLYLKGRFYWNKYTESGYRKSIEYFKQAIEKDPNYALAYSGLADTYSLLGDFSYDPPAEAFSQARRYAQKALSLDEKLASAHLSFGIVLLFYDWNLPEAEKELRRAKELEPNNAQVYHFYGHYLEAACRLEEAIAETKRGVDLDPINLILANEYAWAYYLSHRFDEAIALYRKNLEADPNFIYSAYQLAQCYEQKGMYQEALSELERAQKIDNWYWISAEIACVMASIGQRAEAEKAIAALRERSAHEYIDESIIAYITLALGDRDQTFTWLEKGYQSRAGNLPWIVVEPKFDPLRSDPRFDDLLRRMGLKQ